MLHEVEGLTEDLTSAPLSRQVVYDHESSSQFDRNYQTDAGFSMDADIEPEDTPKDVSRGKSICSSLCTNNKFVFNSFDLETGRGNVELFKFRRRYSDFQNNEAEVEVNVFRQRITNMMFVFHM